MSQSIAVLVDAGYFHKQVQRAALDAQCEEIEKVGCGRESIQLNWGQFREVLLARVRKEFPQASLLRITWYDGQQKGEMSPEQETIASLDNFKVKLGTVSSHGAQKEVDMLIGLDLLQLAQTRIVSDVVVVSGDLDFRPALIAGQALGLRAHIWALLDEAGTAKKLKLEADTFRTIELKDIQTFATPREPALEAIKRMRESRQAEELARALASSPEALLAEVSHERAMGQALPEGCSESFARCRGAARSVLESMEEFSLRMLRQENHSLPAEVDRHLLQMSRQYIGRDLSAAEKRIARKTLLALCKEQPLPPEEDCAKARVSIECTEEICQQV